VGSCEIREVRSRRSATFRVRDVTQISIRCPNRSSTARQAVLAETMDSQGSRSCTVGRLQAAQPTAPLCRVGVAREIPALLGQFGLDADEVVKKAGISLSLLSDPENVVLFAALGRLLRVCVRDTRCTHFGLLVGARGGLLSLGPLGLLAQHAPDVRRALSDLISLLPRQDQGSAAALIVENDLASISYAVCASGAEAADQITDAGVAVVFNVMQGLCGPSWTPLEVLLPRRSPADSSPYDEFFRCPIRFNSEEATIIFSKHWLDRELAGAHAPIHDFMLEKLGGPEDTLVSSFHAAVRRVVRMRILHDKTSATAVADHFGMHRRTLYRRLERDGKSFQRIVDDVKFEIARDWIKNTDISLVSIATALGYSEASSFTRAFRRWSGQSPKRWRMNSRFRSGSGKSSRLTPI
jgi:AraC-like DNA-binding protein